MATDIIEPNALNIRNADTSIPTLWTDSAIFFIQHLNFSRNGEHETIASVRVATVIGAECAILRPPCNGQSSEIDEHERADSPSDCPNPLSHDEGRPGGQRYRAGWLRGAVHHSTSGP